MSLITILLIVLIIMAFSGGGFINGGAYRNEGLGIGTVLIIILVVLLLTGRI